MFLATIFVQVRHRASASPIVKWSLLMLSTNPRKPSSITSKDEWHLALGHAASSANVFGKPHSKPPNSCKMIGPIISQVVTAR
jgi:hypothetical protein